VEAVGIVANNICSNGKGSNNNPTSQVQVVVFIVDVVIS